MSNDQVEKAITFLLEQQAALASKVDANTDAIGKLAEISERQGNELVTIREDMRTMQTEVRDAVNTILGVAESMAENVKTLTALELETRRRVDDLERNRP